jgi:hypothetical protein
MGAVRLSANISALNSYSSQHYGDYLCG